MMDERSENMRGVDTQRNVDTALRKADSSITKMVCRGHAAF